MTVVEEGPAGSGIAQRLIRLRDRLNAVGDLRISRSGAGHEIDAILALTPVEGVGK